MTKLIPLVVLGVLATGGWQFIKKLDLSSAEKALSTVKDVATNGLGGNDQVAAVPARAGSTIKVASYNIQVFGTAKIAKPAVMKTLAEVIRRFDVVAIQEIRSKSDDVMPRLIEMLNSTGRKYDFVIGPRLGRSNSKEQYAVVFDQETIECDRNALYTVNDPDDMLHREPLVAWFRARGPAPHEAFTFSLVNIHTDPDEVAQEVDALAAVFKAVRDDGRNEDDVILLGDLNADDRHLGYLGQVPNIGWAISGVPTNTRGTQLYDNIVFSRQATTEYTGRAGVVDIFRDFNLTMEEALEVSDHLPIWAEFSTYEGGQGGRVATRPTQPR